MHYLPLTPGLFSILVLLFAGLIILIQLRILRYALYAARCRPGGCAAPAVRLADRQLFQYSRSPVLPGPPIMIRADR